MLQKPVTYQRSENSQQAVDSRFVVAKNTVSFEVGNYDRNRELVIDPAVSYATYLGGNGVDDGNAITVNSAGNAYVTGQTKSTNFPTKNALHASNAGGFDVFVTELSRTVPASYFRPTSVAAETTAEMRSRSMLPTTFSSRAGLAHKTFPITEPCRQDWVV